VLAATALALVYGLLSRIPSGAPPAEREVAKDAGHAAEKERKQGLDDVEVAAGRGGEKLGRPAGEEEPAAEGAPAATPAQSRAAGGVEAPALRDSVSERREQAPDAASEDRLESLIRARELGKQPPPAAGEATGRDVAWSRPPGEAAGGRNEDRRQAAAEGSDLGELVLIAEASEPIQRQWASSLEGWGLRSQLRVGAVVRDVGAAPEAKREAAQKDQDDEQARIRQDAKLGAAANALDLDLEVREVTSLTAPDRYRYDDKTGLGVGAGAVDLRAGDRVFAVRGDERTLAAFIQAIKAGFGAGGRVTAQRGAIGLRDDDAGSELYQWRANGTRGVPAAPATQARGLPQREAGPPAAAGPPQDQGEPLITIYCVLRARPDPGRR
jgi:hypothetical protein